MSTCCEVCGSHDIKRRRINNSLVELSCNECGWTRSYESQKPIICQSPLTGIKYKVTKYEDLGGGNIRAIKKEIISDEVKLCG